MALRNHITVLAVALAAMLCTVQAAYGQGPKKTTEELQYVPPPARVVHDLVVGQWVHKVRADWVARYCY